MKDAVKFPELAGDSLIVTEPTVLKVPLTVDEPTTEAEPPEFGAEVKLITTLLPVREMPVIVGTGFVTTFTATPLRRMLPMLAF